jgi:hypothetical protein
MKHFLIGAVSLMVLAAGAPAQAQTYGQTYEQQVPATSSQGYDPHGYNQQYQENERQYESQRRAYDNAYSAYQDQRDTYDAQRHAYEHRRRAYQRQRADYDAKYGPGAFESYFRYHPQEYDDRYGPGAYARDFGPPDADR